jgi:hypothetical protein
VLKDQLDQPVEVQKKKISTPLDGFLNEVTGAG